MQVYGKRKTKGAKRREIVKKQRSETGKDERTKERRRWYWAKERREQEGDEEH